LHKDALAAMNMRRIVKLYALTGEKSTWNKRYYHEKGATKAPRAFKAILERGEFVFFHKKQIM
jgi:hypothetical protein